jgi:D-beta-D-heptose 7-phosphate kinase/D-beta-D-heptose 1-phosphate adenosyltransferase
MNEPNTQPQKQFKILLIGDSCIDEYQYGYVDRLSPEAPIPVFKLAEKTSKEGMVGNVRLNLKNLGCDVDLYLGETSKKTRLIDKRSKQQIVRIDEDVMSEPLKFSEITSLEYDAIVISDYNKGFVSYELIEELPKYFKGLMFIDTKKTDIARMYGYYVKINEHEYNQRWSINDKMIVTLGSKGAMWKIGRDPKYETFFTADPVEVVDVTGAGDTFLATLTYQLLKTKNIDDAIRFAIKASTITVQHFGVYAPRLEEICD